MPVSKNNNGIQNYVSYLKDLIYIIGLVVALAGWGLEKSKSSAILETTVKNNTETLKKVEVFMDSQAELNGKIIQYMAMVPHN